MIFVFYGFVMRRCVIQILLYVIKARWRRIYESMGYFIIDSGSGLSPIWSHGIT